MDVPLPQRPTDIRDLFADDWRTDVLGKPYEAQTIDLGTDDEGEVVATLVRRRADGPPKGAVMHVHGFCDYFFQTEYAEWWTERGYTFYALDLRKYGRSIREHQTQNFVTDLRDYHTEIDEAFRRISERDGHETVVLSAHSTGGLTVPLWVDERRPPISGIVLNSPWFDLQAPWLVRTAGSALLKHFGALRPRYEIPRNVSGLYGRSIHVEHDGDWNYDPHWKPLDSLPVYAGWMRAVREGHARLHRGLDIHAPVLVLSSERSGHPKEMNEEAHTTDIVLDVEQIRRWSTKLGRNVTSVAVPEARHDVVLSRDEPRAKVYAAIEGWLSAFVEQKVSR